jgi:signal transduction histidine kinase
MTMSMPAVKYREETEKTSEALPAAAEAINILIVDDLPEKLLVYRTILEDLNQNLITASSGEEALKLVLKHEFAVILLDVNMPGMDGFETATLIRGRKKSSKTPIIFLTAFTDELNTAQGYASGAVDYLPTPVVPAVLRAKVRVFIELFQMRQQAAIQAEERAKREAAEEADRRKDEFLATLAHELRNPLAPLRNSLQLLQLPNIKPEMITKAYEMMDRQLQHMVRLVDDLMDVSRITRGKIDLRMDQIYLTEAIETALETVRPLIEERKHTLKVEIPDRSIQIEADLVRLSQVFANLLNNAAKYTDPGGRITLIVEQSGDLVLIKIKDTGIGISSERLPEVFEPFMQVDSSLTRSQGGLGIGLTLVKKLIEMQNGFVEAYSQGPNTGSTFIISLPVAKTKKNLKTVDNSHTKPIKKQHLRILVVDDNEASAQTMGWMLEMEGHEVSTVFDGIEAIDLAKKIKPDIILLDIGLPKVSGYEVCEILRKQPSLAHTVFIAQTGWGQPEHRRRSQMAGFDYHLVKPVNSKVLQDVLSTIQKR